MMKQADRARMIKCWYPNKIKGDSFILIWRIAKYRSSKD
jgi:hypothetical protein